LIRKENNAGEGRLPHCFWNGVHRENQRIFIGISPVIGFPFHPPCRLFERRRSFTFIGSAQPIRVRKKGNERQIDSHEYQGEEIREAVYFTDPFEIVSFANRKAHHPSKFVRQAWHDRRDSFRCFRHSRNGGRKIRPVDAWACPVSVIFGSQSGGWAGRRQQYARDDRERCFELDFVHKRSFLFVKFTEFHFNLFVKCFISFSSLKIPAYCLDDFVFPYDYC
jgi:hypothetical protein